MAIKLGSVVEVTFPITKSGCKDPAFRFNGRCFVVKSRRSLRKGTDSEYLYELYGAETEYGFSYTFREENLKVVSESRLAEVDIDQEGDQ